MCPLFVATSYMFLLVTHYKIPPTIFPQAWVGNHEGRHLPETKITPNQSVFLAIHKKKSEVQICWT